MYVPRGRCREVSIAIEREREEPGGRVLADRDQHVLVTRDPASDRRSVHHEPAVERTEPWHHEVTRAAGDFEVARDQDRHPTKRGRTGEPHVVPTADEDGFVLTSSRESNPAPERRGADRHELEPGLRLERCCEVRDPTAHRHDRNVHVEIRAPGDRDLARQGSRHRRRERGSPALREVAHVVGGARNPRHDAFAPDGQAHSIIRVREDEETEPSAFGWDAARQLDASRHALERELHRVLRIARDRDATLIVIVLVTTPWTRSR